MEDDKIVALDLSLPKTDDKCPSRCSPPLADTDQQDGGRIDVRDLHVVSAEVTEKTVHVYESRDRDLNINVDELDAHPPSPKRHKYMDSVKEDEYITKQVPFSHASVDHSLALADNSMHETNRSLGLETSLAVSEASLGVGVSEGAICRTVDGVTVSLHDETLWHAFSDCGTEMIISRGGRRMFPHIVLSFSGLVPDHVYSITLEIVPADDRRYKYINNTWMPMGMADPGPALQPITHPDSPNTGAYWTHNRASFSKVRLTNNKEASCSDLSDGNVLLLSMHKYVAVIKVYDVTAGSGAGEAPPRLYCFDETTFMAVTAYQNYKITHLKIKNNPFAKAFRDFQNSSRENRKGSRRKETSKYSSSLPRDAPTQRPLPAPTLPPAPTCFNPALYYPFPALGGMRPYRPDIMVPGLPGLPDPLHARGVNQAMLNRMAYFPWMAIGDRMNDIWLKNQQRLFGLAYTPTDSQAANKDSAGYERDEERDSAEERESPVQLLNTCAQSAATKDEPGSADCSLLLN